MGQDLHFYTLETNNIPTMPLSPSHFLYLKKNENTNLIKIAKQENTQIWSMNFILQEGKYNIMNLI